MQTQDGANEETRRNKFCCPGSAGSGDGLYLHKYSRIILKIKMT
jgi:hypothetical protein